MPDQAEYIQFLKDTIEYQQRRIDDLERTLMAMTDAKAYTLRYPQPQREPAKVALSSLMVPEVIMPKRSSVDVEKEFEA